MSELQSAAGTEQQDAQRQDQQQQQQEQDTTAGAQQPPPQEADPSTNTAEDQPSALPTLDPPTTTRPPPTRKPSEALGPATDSPIAPPPTSTSGPALSITLMLTTGARHPYKIDEKYLRNRKVEATAADGNFDPREMSGYKLKELIWTDWRSEWEARPASPSSIRLIILGRLVEDKAALRGKSTLHSGGAKGGWKMGL